MTERALNHRETILVEDAEIVTLESFAGAQCVMRLASPQIAERAEPGQFVHMRCESSLAMRRPMSIMRAANGYVDILFKVHGLGTEALAQQTVGNKLSLIGPIGVPFKLADYRKRSLLIGGGVGIPPMVYLADHMRASAIRPFVIMGSEVPFPFTVKPSQIMVPGLPADVIATMPLLEDWGIACRLASKQAFPGCFDGFVTELATQWIEHQLQHGEQDIEIFACGPTPMLRAVADLAKQYELPCQISLEEFMACAVGGCAGCAVRIENSDGVAMRRVCVDGPVFEAADVVFD